VAISDELGGSALARTPAEHRAIVEELRRTTRETDSEIFRSVRRRPRSPPRHSALATQFAALLAWSRLRGIRKKWTDGLLVYFGYPEAA
jgi:hypothetical protein